MRRLAAFVAECAPQLLAICEIGSGDALVLATRFEMQYAYRGRQALLWGSALRDAVVEAPYLPMRAPNPLGRRALLCVRGTFAGAETSIAVTQIASDRANRVPEMRFLRAQMRRMAARAILFASLPEQRTGLSDLGLTALARDGAEAVFQRGFSGEALRAAIARV